MSTVTLQSADSVLKSVYLDAVCDQLNNKTSYFYNQIAKGSEEICGKEVRFPAKSGINGGMGSASETGTLPVSAGNVYADFRCDLKNLYGTIELSDKVIRSSGSSAGALVNVLSAEIDGLLEAAKFNFQRMLFGNGSGIVGELKSAIVTGKLGQAAVKSHVNFNEGMVLDLYTNPGQPGPTGLRVTYVDRNEAGDGTVYFEPSVSSAIASNTSANSFFTLQGSYNAEINGLEHLFDATPNARLYGLDRTTIKGILPIGKTDTTFTEDGLIQFIDRIELKSGAKPNVIIASLDARRKFLDVFSGNRSNTQVLDINGGYRAMSFNEIPVVTDRFAPNGTMYFLNTNDFKLAQISDWQWMENDKGNILSQLEKRPVFTATLVKYANLICKKPGGQGKYSGIVV